MAAIPPRIVPIKSAGIAGIFLIINPITIAGTVKSQIEMLNFESMAFCMIIISLAEVCVSKLKPKKRKIYAYWKSKMVQLSKRIWIYIS